MLLRLVTMIFGSNDQLSDMRLNLKLMFKL